MCATHDKPLGHNGCSDAGDPCPLCDPLNRMAQSSATLKRTQQIFQPHRRLLRGGKRDLKVLALIVFAIVLGIVGYAYSIYVRPN